MKLNKIMLAAAMTFGAVSLAQAAVDQGGGQLSFSGSIIDAPCSISSESVKQDIQLGAISKVALSKTGGHSTPVDIKIKLENCDFADEEGKQAKNNVSVTFNGTAATSDATMLTLAGNASDAGIVFTDSVGNKIKLGTASPQVKLTDDATLKFAAYVQASTASGAKIVPGDFTAVANFQMAYN